jgi:hypothetical protein
MRTPALLSDGANKPVNQQTDQQKEVQPQKQEVELDERRHLNIGFGIFRVYFSDLHRQAAENVYDHVH